MCSRRPQGKTHYCLLTNDAFTKNNSYISNLSNRNWTISGIEYARKRSRSGRWPLNYILNVYHYFSIAASQVDIVAHSMGGLMARGFVQQDDYKRKENYMKGSIHRLITIVTPHLGGPLSKFLYDHRDDRYCFNKNGKILEKCLTPIQLESFYEN